MKKSLVLPAVAVAVALFASGCASRGVVHEPSDNVTLELGAKDYKVTGHGKGKDCTTVILGIQFKNPSLGKAQSAALAESKGKFLLNKRYYDGREKDFWLIHDHCMYVEGTGVSF